MSGDEGNVQDQLDCVLSNLYDFGDDLEANKEIVSDSEQQSEGSTQDIETEEVTGSVEHHLPNSELPTSKRKKKNPSFFFNAIKDELRNQSKSTNVSSSSVSNPNVEVVTFVSRKSKKRARSREVHPDSKINIDLKEEENNQTFDFERARLEVHKFGITGYKKEKQRKFEQERAIMLGAKPPKREYVNYKVYQERKKEQGQAKTEKSHTENNVEPIGKKQKPGPKVRRSKKTKRSSGFAPDGQVGRFRDGALILSTKDIQMIKQSKISK